MVQPHRTNSKHAILLLAFRTYIHALIVKNPEPTLCAFPVLTQLTLSSLESYSPLRTWLRCHFTTSSVTPAGVGALLYDPPVPWTSHSLTHNNPVMYWLSFLFFSIFCFISLRRLLRWNGCLIHNRACRNWKKRMADWFAGNCCAGTSCLENPMGGEAR